MKLYETENRYREFGFERNPFSFVLEPQIVKDFIYQREANRAIEEIKKSDSLVLRLPDESSLSDFTDFYTFFARTLLMAPDKSYFSFEIPGSALLNQKLLGVITSIRNRFVGNDVFRIYQSYFASKIITLYEEGYLQEMLKDFNAEALYKETVESKGANLLEIMNYEPEVIRSEDEESEEYKQRKLEIEEKIRKRDSLREFFYRLIEGENFGPAVVNSLRSVIQRGVQEGPANLIPVNVRTDLIGISKLLNYAYTNRVAVLLNLGQIPFLDEEEIIEYEAMINEATTILSKYNKVVYICRVQDLQIVPDVFESKKTVSLNFSTDFLSVNDEEKELKTVEQFKSLALYLISAWSGVKTDVLNSVEKAAENAFNLSNSDNLMALKLLERAFEEAIQTDSLTNLQEIVVGIGNEQQK
ncbi:MAG: hypothetical protein N2440_06205 [Actinobacteria bacterium]|nr:hypothetical protein [Actinomycetota bacterium]